MSGESDQGGSCLYKKKKEQRQLDYDNDDDDDADGNEDGSDEDNGDDEFVVTKAMKIEEEEEEGEEQEGVDEMEQEPYHKIPVRGISKAVIDTVKDSSQEKEKEKIANAMKKVGVIGVDE